MKIFNVTLKKKIFEMYFAVRYFFHFAFHLVKKKAE